MKKIYIQPQMKVVNIQQTSSILVPGSITILGDSGTATFFNENATGAAMVKRNYTDYNVWDDDWSN